jgi:hypothetical protein
MSDRSSEPADAMLDEYDFSGGARGKYAHSFSDNCKLIVLDPDVAEAFPDAHAVNDALRELILQRTPAGRKG